MNKLWKEIVTAAVMGMAVPGFLIWFAAGLLENYPQTEPATQPEAVTRPAEGPVYEILLRGENGTEAMALEEYLVGVVLGEMPASFETEALKAQAVVARTYTMLANRSGGKHADGSICADPGCCQAYIEPEEYLSHGGTEESVQKIRSAVADTSALVLTYEGALIEATYFSCSGGRTEDAVAVWGSEYPYLQAVESPGEEHAAYHTDTVTFTPEEFQAALGVTLPGTPDSWFGAVTYTDGGGVDTMVIGDGTYRGTELRKLLGLRSTAFTVSAGEKILITTRGYGHRVGMSQYGADAMALAGSDYGEILAHYYQGTVLTPLSAVEN